MEPTTTQYHISRSENFVIRFWTGYNWTTNPEQAMTFETWDEAYQHRHEVFGETPAREYGQFPHIYQHTAQRCRHCLTVLPMQRMGRKRKYCNDTCKQAAHRERVKDLQDNHNLSTNHAEIQADREQLMDHLGF